MLRSPHPPSQEDLGYLLALVRFQKLGAVRLGNLRNFFPTYKDIFHGSREEWLAASIPPKVTEAFFAAKATLNPEQEWNLLETTGAHAIAFEDDRYPSLLREIFDPPAVLFVRGELSFNEKTHLAVVGSRKATHYGTRVVKELVQPLAQAGFVIVSGLAIGIDACAHAAALESGGTTVAVLGAGVDDNNIYPSQNRSLASHIMAGGGAVISEFPIGTHVLKQNFPFRNRIIAGMSHATLVVEAAEKSGSLITARSALESNREVFAVPGSIHAPLCAGPNTLIKAGAIPVTEPNDILETFGLSGKTHSLSVYSPASEEERNLMEVLGGEPIHIDEIVRASALPPATITSTLTLLEIEGAVRHVGGRFYVRDASKT